MTGLWGYAEKMQCSEFFPEPTAHEIWVRNYIPRGAHYDTADDGPETNAEWRAWMINVIDSAAITQVVQDVLDSDNWLNAHSHTWDTRFDLWEHPRE